MATQYDGIEPVHAAFIEAQHIFFVASAAATGRVNVSPRGADAFRVLGPNRVAYLDQTGSGNETAAHLQLLPRLTIMFCGFEAVPMILRLYGTGACLPRGTAEYDALLADAFAGQEQPGARQIVVLEVDLVQRSCGYGVPLFDYREDRPTLLRWAEGKGADGVDAYRRQRNRVSLDGFPTWVDALPEVEAVGEAQAKAGAAGEPVGAGA